MGDYGIYSEGHALSDGTEHDEPDLPTDEDERGAREEWGPVVDWEKLSDRDDRQKTKSERMAVL